MRAALADAQESAHAQLAHLLHAQDLDLDPELAEALGFDGQRFGIDHIGGLAHQFAREEDAIRDLVERLVKTLSLGRLRDEEVQLLEAGLVIRFFFRAVFIESPGTQARTLRNQRRHLRPRRVCTGDAVDQHRCLAFAAILQLSDDAGTDTLSRLTIELLGLAESQQQDSTGLQAIGSQNRQCVFRCAFEPACVDRARDRTSGRAVEHGCAG